MDYAVVDPEGLEPEDDRPCDCRQLSEPAGLEQLAVNFFRAEPGEQIPLAYHYHEIQEEAFVVQSGVLHVETPEGEFTVPAGATFAAQPGAPHRAYNPDDAETAVEVIALGAPAVDGDAVQYDPTEDGR
ncbi:cupin domain-containing protein [Natrialba sp. INN-245]|uniref:cupin domain-containing protein n=1 Tax=Natrialba sp. INN-245 TaxID=2690967 RepID=UPI00131352C6|nr:cupin domain-containing protein [Natrialba sp. INN-245]MWV41665.1 cupin domain-containing protein [Natrialba sp. INN-245]